MACPRCAREDCKADFWAEVVERGTWEGRATSREDARTTASSARGVCDFMVQRKADEEAAHAAVRAAKARREDPPWSPYPVGRLE
jgi:hypothetical protein